VYDVQDLWPESALASGLMQPGILVKLLYRLAAWVYRRAARLLVVSDEAAEYLRSRGVDGGKISVARHWIDLTPFESPDSRDVRSEFGWGNRFVVMFAGNLGMVQGLETVIEAASLLRDRSDVQVVFVGDGSDRTRLEALVADWQLSNVSFLGRHPQDEMPAFLRAADVLLVHLRRSDVADHAIPTKILSYMAAGRPIVCATSGAAAHLVRAAGAGLATEPGDAVAIAAAIAELASLAPAVRDALGRSGREYVMTHFMKHVVIDSYERALIDIAGVHIARPVTAEERV
jgi:glycosyltransferase involved in cell wall biosynthesis